MADVLRVFFACILQGSSILEENKCFFQMLKDESYMHGVDVQVVCLCDFNWHIGMHINGIRGG